MQYKEKYVSFKHFRLFFFCLCPDLSQDVYVHTTGPCDHFMNSSIVILDPQNIGLEVLFAH